MRIPISMKVESDNSRWNVFFSLARNCVRTQHIYTIYGRVSCTLHALVVGRVHAWCLLPACLTLCSPNFSRFHVQQTQKEKNCLTNIPTYEGVSVRRGFASTFRIQCRMQCARNWRCESGRWHALNHQCVFSQLFSCCRTKIWNFPITKNFASLPRADKLHHRLLSEIQRNAYSLKLTEFTSKVRK